MKKIITECPPNCQLEILHAASCERDIRGCGTGEFGLIRLLEPSGGRGVEEFHKSESLATLTPAKQDFPVTMGKTGYHRLCFQQELFRQESQHQSARLGVESGYRNLRS